MRTTAWFLALPLAALLAGQNAANATIGPVPTENYASLHGFGPTGIVDIRHMALGGAHAGDDRDGWHGNPCGMLSLKRGAAEIHQTWAPFSRVPDVHRLGIGIGYRIGEKDVIKILGTSMTAKGEMVGFSAPMAVDAKEDSFSIEWAHKAGDRITIGAATAYLGTESTYTVSQGTLTRLASRPIFPGGRVGFQYKMSSDTTFGAYYDNYWERVTQEAPLLQMQTRNVAYHSTGVRLGVAWYPDENTTLLLDHQNLSVNGDDKTHMRRGIYYGAERKIGPVALRAGLFDGLMSGGAGVKLGAYQVDYCFSRKHDKDVPGMGAQAGHAIQVRTAF